MMLRTMRAAAIMLIAFMSASALASIGQHWGPEISDARARRIALAQTGGGSVISDSRGLDGGYLIYRMVVAAPAGGFRRVEIGAMSGKVLSSTIAAGKAR